MDIEGPCDPVDIFERNIAQTVFDIADVGSVQIGTFGQSLLGHTQLLSSLPNGCPEFFF